MPEKRGRLMMIHDILKAAKQPEKPTRIALKTHINNVTCLPILKHLATQGFIKKTPTTHNKKTPYLYVVTPEGKKLLTTLHTVYKQLGWRRT